MSSVVLRRGDNLRLTESKIAIEVQTTSRNFQEDVERIQNSKVKIQKGERIFILIAEWL